MNPTIATVRHNRSRRLPRIVATLGGAVLVLAGAVGPVAADEPYYGYKATTTASVSCDDATNTMSVSAYATTMQAQGFYGPTTGVYDAGQWMRYNVFARELGASSWTQVYTWSSWQWIVSLQPTSMSGVTMQSPQNLGTSVVNGTDGHSYEVLVEIDFWTDRENVFDVTPSYSQALQTDAFNTFYFTPGYCHL